MLYRFNYYSTSTDDAPRRVEDGTIPLHATAHVRRAVARASAARSAFSASCFVHRGPAADTSTTDQKNENETTRQKSERI